MNADVQPYKMINFTDVESRECCHNRVEASKSRGHWAFGVRRRYPLMGVAGRW
jgi:hypothetical protein